ncbi:MAG: GMC family oxidoreductase [Syntrophobacterales bacterium]|nr:MAG: GMC family oxidoreductase [Syntrophobacterales bacterium]
MSEDSSQGDFDFDYIVIGSGFGGSVAAMRLSQKGYKVGVIESGKRWNADEFAKSNWNIKKFLWFPTFGCYGIQRMHLLKDVFVLAAAGVGGGSLNYANTMYTPPQVFFERETIQRLGGKTELLPYFDIAKKMLGVVVNPNPTPQDQLLKDTAAEIGRDQTYTPADVAVFFGEEKMLSEDPYFFGEGPDRIGCELCGECMTGCKKNAKNTLDKNYLYFAEKFGTQIFAEQKVYDIIPLSPNGDKGYIVKSKKTTGILGRINGKTFKTKGIVHCAGVIGTLSLLMKLKQTKSLPLLSDHLGEFSRTNSESIIGVKSKSKKDDFSKGVAITSSVHPDENTHIEPVRYGKGHDFMGLLTGIMTEGGGMIPRQVKAFVNALCHPITFLRILNPVGFAQRSIILLIMQTLDNYINIKRKRRFLWPFSRTLTSSYGTEKKNPTWIPIGYDFGRRLAKRMNGIPCNITTENLMDAPITAHIMGGCTIGQGPDNGVIDEENWINGYHNMLVCDASQMPENLGVNPALSILAFSERAMAYIQPKSGKIRYLKAEEEWGVKEYLLKESKHKKIE